MRHKGNPNLISRKMGKLLLDLRPMPMVWNAVRS
jgi:hypothetical protein